MTEQQIRAVVEQVLQRLQNDAPAEKKQPPAESGDALPDVSAVDLRTQYLVEHPHDQAAFLAMKERTPARIGVGHIRLEELVRRILLLQDEEGRWIKAESTPAFTVERIHQPSRWLTLEAVHTLTLIYGDMIYAPGRSA